TILPDAPVGPLRAAFEVALTCQRVPAYRIAVIADVTAFYRMSERRLFFGSLAPGESQRGGLEISGDRPFEVVDLGDSTDELEVTLEPGGSPNTFLFDVEVLPTAVPGRKEEEITFTVKSGHQSFQEKVPIIGLVTKQESS
ncbi:MAG TPA: hypothetical protein HPP83_09880, partial [Candidatus Hydrogenedentes bacterium]|nr:hypothetical protein [Candidatus Hydrogenedentota bacterium]